MIHRPNIRLMLHEALVQTQVDCLFSAAFNRTLGICGQVRERSPYVHRMTIKQELLDLMAKWPKGTGDSTYPVPGGLFSTAANKFDGTKDKWKGRYGKRRMALLKWLIDQTSPYNEGV